MFLFKQLLLSLSQCGVPGRVHHHLQVLTAAIGAIGSDATRGDILAQGMIKQHAHPRACTVTSRLHGSGARFFIVIVVAIVLELHEEVTSESARRSHLELAAAGQARPKAQEAAPSVGSSRTLLGRG